MVSLKTIYLVWVTLRLRKGLLCFVAMWTVANAFNESKLPCFTLFRQCFQPRLYRLRCFFIYEKVQCYQHYTSGAPRVGFEPTSWEEGEFSTPPSELLKCSAYVNKYTLFFIFSVVNDLVILSIV